MDKLQHPQVIRPWTTEKTRKSTRQGLTEGRRENIRHRKSRPRNKA